MTIKRRFAVLLGLLLAGLIGLLVVLRQLERREMIAMLMAERESRAQLLNHWIEATGRALPQFTSDTAGGDELARLLANNPPDAARVNLESSLAAAGVQWLWVLSAKGEVRFQAAGPQVAPAPPPLTDGDFVALVNETPSPRFFAESAGELIEVSIRRMQPGRTERREWLVVARRWDDAQLHALAGVTDAEVSLLPGHAAVHTLTAPTEIELLRPLNDWRGHPVRVLRMVTHAAEIETAIRGDWRQVQSLGMFGILLLIAMALALHQWVVQPLQLISASLAADRPESLGSLPQEQSELGRVARLVVTASDQRQALQREIAERAQAQAALESSEVALRRHIEERARLGRDLHDGVIQSLYAAGMGLASVRALLRPEQEEVAARLEQTRGALNETIHDVRNFIIGLEPEALKQQTFAQAVAAMLEVMRSLRPFRSTLDIDEQVAHRLTLAQRVHALQITREAVSNALRHGLANHIQVVLRPRGEFAEFELTDDGGGFDATTAGSQGKGLANFAQRARELGATLDVQSHAGRGTRVKLVFSLLIL